MKTRTSIYHRTFAFAYVLLVAVIFCGCGNETTKQELTPIDKIYPIIDKIERSIKIKRWGNSEYA